MPHPADHSDNYKTRLLLVDDNEPFLQITSRFLEQFDDLVVVGTATSGADALARAPDLQPHVVLLDLAMPGLSGLETLPRLRALLPKAAIVVLTVFEEDECKTALDAGANAVVTKHELVSDLVPAIRRVTGGKWRVTREVASAT